jgi:hypothetical protein
MTPALRRRWLATLAWSQHTLAELLEVDPRAVRRWFAPGGVAPPQIDAWLERRAAAMAADPPPVRGRDRA